MRLLHILAACALCTGSAFAASGDWPQLGFNAKGHRENTQETVLTRKTVKNLKPVWSVPFAGGLPVMVANGVAYASTSTSLYAFDAATGAQIWQTKVGTFISSAPAIANGTVFIGAGTRLVAVDAESGAVRWSMLAGSGGIEAAPTVVAGTVYVGNDHGQFYAVNARTGVVRWTYATQMNGVVAAASVGGGMVYFADNSGELDAFDVKTGAHKWTAQIDSSSGSYVGQPAYDHGAVYVATRRSLAGFDAATGARRWSSGLGEADSSLALAKGHIHMATSDHLLWDFDAATGTLDKYENAGMAMMSTPAIANGVLYVGSMSNTISAYDAKTEALLWQAATAAPLTAAPTISNGRLYIADGHTLTAYGLE